MAGATKAVLPAALTAASCCMLLCAVAGPRSFAPAPSAQRPLSRNLHASGEAAAYAAPASSVAGLVAPGVSGVAVLALALALSTSRSRRMTRDAASRAAAVSRSHVALKASVMQETPAQVDFSMEAGDSAIVKKTSVLVLGATGTLGRQVVRQFLNAGYSVRCLIRNRDDRPFSFLVDWGASVVEGSLIRSETLPTALIGIHSVIDCSTARPEESIYDVDWEGKKKFIQCCEKMDIQRYVFMSIKDCDNFQNVPLMQIKYLTEQLLIKSKMRHTIVRATGFFQPLVATYAVAVLDDQKVWSDDNPDAGIAYIDSQDCARMVAAAASKERTVGQTLTITGPKLWSSQELIELCEQLSGKKAEVSTVPSLLLQVVAFFAGGFQFGIDIAERLRFVEVTQGGNSKVMSDETYAALGMDKGATRKLEEYIGEYYRRVMKMLAVGQYTPEEGEAERLEAEEEAKLKQAIAKAQEDKLLPGQPEEREVSVVAQREMAGRLQKYFEDKILEKINSKDNDWFGLTPLAEIINGRAAMMGFSLGLFTEWATEVSVTKQIDELIAIFSASGA